MSERNANQFLAVKLMRITVILILFGVLVCISHSIGQIIGNRKYNNLGEVTGITNNLTTTQVGVIVSRLHIGMTKCETVSFLETNHVKGWADILEGGKSGGGFVSQSNGWKSAYYLSNGCLLTFDYAGTFDTNGQLCGALLSANIVSNEVAVVPILLKSAP